MEYAVERKYESGNCDPVAINLSMAKATSIAKREAKIERGQVYITWFRPADGQMGYLNRDGHSPVGKAW